MEWGGSMITIAVVDHDQMLLDGARAWMRDIPDIDLVATARTVEAFEALRLDGPDVLVLSYTLASSSLARLVEAGARILILGPASMRTKLLDSGASGYLTRGNTLAALVTACRRLSDPAQDHLGVRHLKRPRLSPKERAVAVAYASGMTLAAVARHVGIRPGTAKSYLDRVKAKYRDVGRPTFTKLDVASRVREDNLRP